MDEVKINTSKTITLNLPSDPASNAVSASLYHEFGDLVSGPTSATRTGAGIYTITYGQKSSGHYVLDSSGKYKVVFTYTVSGVEYTKTEVFNVYSPYITYEQFFEEYPELESENSVLFDKAERKVRNIINTFTGQSFDPFYNKKIVMMGNNSQHLHLPLSIWNLKKVVADEGATEEQTLHDYTDSTINNMEKVPHSPFNFNSSYYIRWKYSTLESTTITMITNRFKKSSKYSITGDYGWEYVPGNIQEASALLLADLFNDDSSYRRHGIASVDLDVVKFNMKDKFYESTGNIDADVLLMDYTTFIMDYIV